MPKDTIWIFNNEKSQIFEFNTTGDIDKIKLFKIIEGIDKDDKISCSYKGNINPRKDSIIHMILLKQENNRIIDLADKNNNFSFLGYGFIFLVLILFLLLLKYILKKRKEYIKDPAAAEAYEKWEEIGTSNNYDTSGDGGFNFGD